MADGLHYLHSLRIIHGNLEVVGLFTLLQDLSRQILISTNSKANVIIDNDGHARLKGFWLSSFLREEGPLDGPWGVGLRCAPTWLAPEISDGGIATEEGDILRFGVVTVEVCARGLQVEISQLTHLKRRLRVIPRLETTESPRVVFCVGRSLNDRRR